MGKVEFARDRLRVRLSKLVDEYEAMVILLARMSPLVARQIENEREGVKLANKSQLQLGTQKLSATINRIRRDAGATQPVGYYSSLLNHNQLNEGWIRTIPVYVAVALFNKYPRLADALQSHELPIHATIELDYLGEGSRPEIYEFRITEAMLFEDMCFFWNESCAIHEKAIEPGSSKQLTKRLIAFHRAAVSAAFYMVEAFCNGIALEIFLTRRDELSEQELEWVTEWNAKHSRPRYLSIRDKLLKYPRLLLDTQAPPIQENNSPELSFFLSSAKELRDAIVHANPAPNLETLLPQKTQIFERLDHDQCARVIDSSIEVVNQIATSVGRDKSIFWLQTRKEDGAFDDSVFD